MKMVSKQVFEPEKTHYRTIFLSDIHLGTKGCQSERLIDFLKHHSCERLYLVGDIIDGWRMSSSVINWSQSHNNVLRRFMTLMKRGTLLIYVTGNHDEFMRSHSPLEIGNLSIVDEAIHRTADGRRLLIIHGDQFDVVTRYHRWIAWLGDIGYTLLLELNRHLNRFRQRYGYGYWSLSAWTKQRVKQAVSYIGDFEEAVAHQCRRRKLDGVVCGHIHHAEITEFDGTTYMNCGDWVESCTALVEDETGSFSIIDWSRTQKAAGNVVDFPPEPDRLSA
jgi:UDP-2,3-diacylglucosamine pyrophosphatase LpxH